MSPEAQKAFEAWWASVDSVAAYDTQLAFEAGFNAAIVQTEVSSKCQAGDAGSTPAGSTVSTERVDLTDTLLVLEPSPWTDGIFSTPVTAEMVYAAYPRKVGRGAAIKAIQKAAKLIGPKATSTTRFCPYAVLLERTQAFAKATASWPEADRHFICHPATWFNQERYNDDPKEWERGTAPSSQFSQSY